MKTDLITEISKHYFIANVGEIYLKGDNIEYFEKKLISNLQKKINIKNLTDFAIFRKKHGGSIYIQLDGDSTDPDFSKKHSILKNILETTPGIQTYFEAISVSSDFDKIKNAAEELAKKEVSLREKNNQTVKSFAVRSSRNWKKFPKKSNDINREIGSVIFYAINKEVNLSYPDLTIFIKITKNETFLYTKKHTALGGLPISSSGKSLALFSGGIDSPVASFLAMNRGLHITALHFHSVPQTSPESIEKVKSLVTQLSKFQPKIKLYLIPSIPLQKAIAFNCPEKLRIILQRRLFLQVAEKISKKEKTQGFITGDSIGQVASQTIENLTAVSEISDQLMIRPLIGLDKNNIIDMARKIGTYEISILPHEDTCGTFAPKKPETKAKLKDVLKAHESIPNIEEVIRETLNATEIIHIEHS